MANRDNYQLLIGKLDEFIRRYYINQLIRGTLYSVGLILLLFLAVNLLEHYFYFSTTGRKLLFFSFLGISLSAIAMWILIPLLHYFRLGQVISHEQAATIIGQHFTNVKDKLLNILQLKRQADEASDTALILASINQKSEEIRLVPFQAAIDLSQNRRYLKYALPPLLLLLVLLFAAPSIIRDSTERLIHNGREYLRPAPFQFQVAEDDLSVVQFGDYPLEVIVEGAQLPNEVFIEIDDYQYRLKKEAPNRFSYQFNNVQQEMRFRLSSGEVESYTYTLNVLKKPNINHFEVKLDYPEYTGRTDETVNNIGDLTVPAGTRINWVFNAENTQQIEIQFAGQDKAAELRRFSDDLFTLERRALKDETYKLYVSSEHLRRADSMAYSLAVIPDLYPEITVERFQDSTQRKLLFFAGEASDDYGLSRLTFNYQLRRKGSAAAAPVIVPLNRPQGKQARYDYTWDLQNIELQPGDELTYYFEVHDNDGVSGAKASRTGLMTYTVPTLEEISAQTEKNNSQIKDDLRKALEESQKIQQDLKKMREKLLQEKEMDWKTRKEFEKLLNRQQELQKQIEQAKNTFQQNLENQQEFKPTDENIQEKQEKLEELFEKAVDQEMQELMEQIQELMEQLQKDQALEMMKDVQLNDEEMEMEIDRLLELFKQLELEQQMQETMQELEKLAEEQEQLSEETREEQKSQEELQQQQEEINQEFDRIQEQMENMQQKNQELQKPMNIDQQKEQQDQIQEELNNSKEQLQKQQNQKASQSQQKASQKMKEMANNMSEQMQGQQMEQMQEDMESLRQLLENLVGLSFDQEDLIKQFGQAEINTPRYVDLVQQQFKIQDDFKLVEDSLQALAKRVIQIESFITDKVTDIKGNMRTSLEDLEERRKPQAAEHQQRAMTNINDLALMLSETMQQMQQQMSSMMSGAQMCQKPGGQGQQGQQPQDKISKGQELLNDEMKQTLERMRNGQRGSSEEFAKMAAKQAALRKALEQQQRERQQRGKGSKELQDIIDQMDKAEEELVNKRLHNEMLNRQQDILSRLLEHEKAERERELDEQRQSETASQRERELPPSLQEYIKKREAEIDMFKSVSPTLKPYYKYLVDEYFQSLRDNR